MNLHLNYLFAGFCSVTWPHVNSLAITTEDGVWYRLGNGVFDCLGYLRSFRLSSRYLVSFDYGTFTGLTNLTTFDISGCQRITLENVYEILYWSNSFPFLTHVLLASVNPSTLQVIDQKFIDALSTRRITYIDLSNNYLGLTFTSANILCNSLHTLVIRDASLFFEIEFWRLGKCSSLQVYDNSGTGSITPLSCINDTWLQISHTFFKAVKVLFSNRKIHSPTMSIANCTLDFCSDSSIEELHFAENNLPSFEFKMKNPRIKFLNLSHNKIENINRDAVRYLPSLTRLDLSNNDLSETNAFDTISHLFRYNTQLRDIDLSANNLEFLPNETFANKAHLELMNLSSNAFDQIHFHFWNLPNLTTIDLSFNKMVNLDSHSRHSLDNWYRFHPEKHESVSLILHGNPFSCSCSSLDFVKWFVASPIFSSPPARQYFCHIDNQRMPLTVNAVQGDCDRIRKERLQIILESTLIPISLIVLLVLAVVLYRRYKRKQREKLQDDRIRLLRENEAMFAVFLSHSSDENEFVRNNILKPLQVCASKYERFTFLISHAYYLFLLRTQYILKGDCNPDDKYVLSERAL